MYWWDFAGRPDCCANQQPYACPVSKAHSGRRKMLLLSKGSEKTRGNDRNTLHPVAPHWRWPWVPLGYGGERFAPNSYLAKFPPDSGYVRGVAVGEMGWIGLLIYCIFNFVILYMGIRYFYLIKDPELKTYCLAMILIIFSFYIGNYPQQKASRTIPVKHFILSGDGATKCFDAVRP